jgi:hypothetical protein
MDAAGLRDRIQATLDPNAAIRQQAELDLKHVRVPMPMPMPMPLPMPAASERAPY